jgi:hypothetical protein
MAAYNGSFGLFPNLSMPNRPSATIRRGIELSLNTHLIWSYSPHYHFLCELAKLSKRAWFLLKREKSWYEYYKEFFHSHALISSI